MKISNVVKNVMAAGVLFASSAVHATVLTLPGANEMTVGVYNSFNVYSLDLLDKCAAALDPRCMPTIGTPVQSSPGNITDQAVVLQTADGQTNFPNPFAVGSPVDDRFLTPTGSQSNTYAMGTFDGGTEEGGKFIGDQTNRWEIKLSLLQDYLDGHDLVFLFDNNQSANAQAAFIFLWGQARIVDAAGNIVGGHCYELSTLAGGCADTGADPSPANDVFVEGVSDFCVDKATGAAYNIGGAGNANDCPVTLEHPQGGYQVTNNQSTAVAEFAAFNQALHDAATSLANGEYFLQLNMRYFSNNGGAEQLWICSDCDLDRPTTEVPEPSSLPLIALGLLIGGVSYLRSRRK